MKRFTHVVLLIVVVLALGLVAARPFQGETPPAPDETPLTVPAEIQLALTGGLVFILTAGLKALSQAFPKIPNLEGEATTFVGAVVTFVVVVGNALLLLVPPEAKPYVILFFAGVATWLSANGIALVVKGFQKKATSTTSAK